MSPKREKMANPELFRHLLYSGSVKDVYGQVGRDPYIFVFSDRYSIFDWGEMPDSLSGKGEALAVMGDLFFRHLGRKESWSNWQIPETYPKFWRDSFTSSRVFRDLKWNGLAHHSFGLVTVEGDAVPPGGHSNRLAVRALDRPPARSETKNGKLFWDYSAYASRPKNALVPLEVVFRFGAPEGSSFLQRAESMPGYAQSFGFSEKPAAGQMFPYPIVEFFTKLEPSDRFLTRQEALEVGGLLPEELDELVAVSLLLAVRLRDLFSPLGLELWDGKFEFAFQPGKDDFRSFLLVDSIGPDELRLIGPGGVHFSKEFLRRAYRGTPWYQAMEKAKKLAKDRGVKDWKNICRNELQQEPERLSAKVVECARMMYPALADGLARQFLGTSAYENVPTVEELCRQLKEVL
jgi:phosphoribosylaminoimidazole-succinocarboxamide synthase